jgi:hypothetical protein
LDMMMYRRGAVQTLKCSRLNFNRLKVQADS